MAGNDNDDETIILQIQDYDFTFNIMHDGASGHRREP